MSTISYEESLMLNFFHGEIYFVFDNQEDVKDFLEYLEMYDNRNFSQISKEKVRSVAWLRSKSLQHSQIEYMDDDIHFKKVYKMRPVDYSLVKKYIGTSLKIRRKFLPLFKVFFNGILDID